MKKLSENKDLVYSENILKYFKLFVFEIKYSDVKIYRVFWLK